MPEHAEWADARNKADLKADLIEALRLRIGRIGGAASGSPDRPAIRFGLDGIDAHLPGGGLAPGALHEVLGHGPDTEHGTLASLLVGGLLGGHDRSRQVLWAMRGDDLFAPGLAAVGLRPDRLILARCGRSVLAVMEEALRHPGLAAVVGEVEGVLGLTASRRLQLAAEASGVPAFAIRRSRRHDDPALLAPSAAVSRLAHLRAAGAGPVPPSRAPRPAARPPAVAAAAAALPRHPRFPMDPAGLRCPTPPRLRIRLAPRFRAAGSAISGCRTGRSIGSGARSSGARNALRLSVRWSPPPRTGPA